jgi:hypothetical protein
VVKGITASVLPHGERITIGFNRHVASDRHGEVRLPSACACSADIYALQQGTDRGSRLRAIRPLRIGRHPNNVTRFVLELAGNPT